jgi:Zn/Cd-binding protein ZinT
MKTAMTEWFDELKANYPYMANEIFDKGFNKYLEKEKEQIIKDYHKGQMGIADLYKESLKKIGVYEELLTDFEDAEEYYNQTYKQNK